MFHRLIMLVGCLLLAGTIFAPRSWAGEWNKKTKITFTEPVEVPPGVILPTGTYVFTLADSQANRDIVQIFNQEHTKLFTTTIVMPVYRMNPTGKTVVEFERRTKDSPEAVETWFYPEDYYGFEFVYPEAEAAENRDNK